MTIATEEEIDPPQIVLDNIDWALYQKILRASRGRNLRFTYDEGVLAIMSPLPEHERSKTLIGSFVETLCEELNIPIASLGSTTLNRKSLLKGVEPDECFYVQHEPDVRAKKRLDLRRDPPPDLVIEVDVTSRSVHKQPIYAAMRVPELWSYDRGKLLCLQLKRGKYFPREHSLAFPFLRPADMESFLAMIGKTDESTIRRAWRQYVVTKLAKRA